MDTTSHTFTDVDGIWDETVDVQSETQWTSMSNEFTNTGYREGITAGKEESLQEGFDAGFAQVGAPLGQELGRLRGMASVIVSFLTSQGSPLLDDARQISASLSNIRFSDIAPRDLEAEEHARQHLEAEIDEIDVPEEIDDKRKMENLEDMLNRLSSGNLLSASEPSRPTIQDVHALKERLATLVQETGLDINWS